MPSNGKNATNFFPHLIIQSWIINIHYVCTCIYTICAFARGCCCCLRKSDESSSKQSYSQNDRKCWNQVRNIIEGLHAGRIVTEIIRFFEYLQSTVYNVVALKQSNEDSNVSAKKNHSKKRTARILAVLKELISDDPGQSLQKLASIVGVSESTMCRIAEENLICMIFVSSTY